MTLPRSLAEIVEEGENAERAYRDAKPFTSSEIGAGNWCHSFYAEHGPRLLAVARAAMWVADDMRYRAPEQAPDLYRLLWLAHLDAAAAGADEGEGRG